MWLSRKSLPDRTGLDSHRQAGLALSCWIQPYVNP